MKQNKYRVWYLTRNTSNVPVKSMVIVIMKELFDITARLFWEETKNYNKRRS